MKRDQIALTVMDACHRIARRYRQFDPNGGEVLGRVYESVSCAVAAKPNERGNETYVRISAERQARREYVRLLRERLTPLDQETER